MLVLSRREGEKIRIGDSIVITVVRTIGDKVRIGIDAPSDVLVLRDELEPRSQKNDRDNTRDENRKPVQANDTAPASKSSVLPALATQSSPSLVPVFG